MGMYDNERRKPVDYFIVHNSVSPEGDDVRKWTNETIRNWFNAIGKVRTYLSEGYKNSDHFFDGKETFAAVQIACWPNGDTDSLDTDTWRVVPLVDDIQGYICWHAGNWPMNCRSVGCELYGRYDNKELPERAVWAMANWIRDNIDQWNGGETQIRGHREVSDIPTGCPNRAMDRIDLLIDMTNNSDIYAVNFDPKKEWEKNSVDIATREYIAIRPTSLIDIASGNREKEFNQGDVFDIARITRARTQEYAITPYSRERNIWKGIPMMDLTPYIEPSVEPVVEPTPVVLPQPTPEPVPVPQPTPVVELPKPEPIPQPSPPVTQPEPVITPPVVVPEPIPTPVEPSTTVEVTPMPIPVPDPSSTYPWWKKWTERKFLLAVGNALLVLLNNGFNWGLTIEDQAYITGTVVSFIAGETILDYPKIKQQLSMENVKKIMDQITVR